MRPKHRKRLLHGQETRSNNYIYFNCFDINKVINTSILISIFNYIETKKFTLYKANSVENNLKRNLLIKL